MPRLSFDPAPRSGVVNALTGEPYFLVRADLVEPVDARLDEITSICNEAEVHRWLFSEMLNGRPYPRAKAAEFVTWYTQGWREGTHFVFLVTTADGVVAAACDIKSAEADGAEIGYWASAQHTGVMTSAVRQLCVLAGLGGFRTLTARVLKANGRSARVLLRSGFVPTRSPEGSRMDHYALNLVA